MKLWIGILVIGMVFFSAFWYYYTQTAWVSSPSYNNPSASKTLVVSYSRTGNTQAAAKELAKYLKANLIHIEAPRYKNDIEGLQRASNDASNEVTSTIIKHDKVDLKQYDVVVLCTPTWWFRPAVPMFAFVENHDFLGKDVYLMMTGNSRKTEEKTGLFIKLLSSKNGNLKELIFVKRGRIFWQKSKEEVNQEFVQAFKDLGSQ